MNLLKQLVQLLPNPLDITKVLLISDGELMQLFFGSTKTLQLLLTLDSSMITGKTAGYNSTSQQQIILHVRILIKEVMVIMK